MSCGITGHSPPPHPAVSRSMAGSFGATRRVPTKKRGSPQRLIEASLLKWQGITEIEDAVEDLVYGGEIVQKESMMVNNVRHIELLQQAVKSLTDALHMSEMREALDFIEVDVKNAYERLGEIIGETVSDDIINEVFARFCLGK